ncbi:MAG: chemotaxis signal relay system methyl-accepting signal transducer [Idiomarinaceae bacterium HL-53]|nr:MAG: chemotaxis signal relay system methyl-accepting signal transducer [Idiomarinaceae bacterium HL-53]CUS47563.1 methyl-accepting chemotaxis protein [Idiomarinaceae bacterium HL-53]
MKTQVLDSETFNFRPLAFRIANATNLFLLIIAFGLASWHGFWLPAFIVGIPSVIIPWAFYKNLGDTLLSRVSFGVSFMFLVALQIHLAMGLTEIHFGIFVLLAILVVFRDWLVILSAAVVIAVHHILFMYLQASGASFYILPEEYLSFSIILVHALYVVAESVVLIIIAQASLKEAKVSQAFLNVTSAMSEGEQLNLTYRCPYINSESIIQFNTALNKIGDTVSVIQSASSQIKSDSDSLIATGEQLIVGMEKKLKEVQQIAAATEEMSITADQTAQLASDANQAALQASDAVKKGKNAVVTSKTGVSKLAEQLDTAKATVTGMASSVDDIRTVLGVINTIAEQTNLLALNAAIEAARAGEQGRGFAVVADEVRQLASQTQGSTEQIQKNINALISSSDASVAIVVACLQDALASLEAVENTGAEFDKIEKSAIQVRDSVLSISTALEEQATATNEIATSIQHLSDMEMTQEKQGRVVFENANSVGDVSQKLDLETRKFIMQ